MRTIPSRFTGGVAAAVVAACASLLAATAVDAQTPPAQPDAANARAPMPPHDGMRGGPGMHGGADRDRGPEAAGGHEMHGPGRHMMREAARLKTSLQLNAQQAALWDRAVAAMKPQGDPRSEMKTRHERMTAMLDDPNFDPRKLAAEVDRAETEHRARMSMVRDAWFALYDSLNPVQRGQVREFLREKIAHGPMGMRDHGEWGSRGGEHGRMPPPPAAPNTITR